MVFMAMQLQSYKEKFVKDLSFNDSTICLCGRVLQKRDQGFILGDDTGEVYVNMSELSDVNCDEGRNFRVFGRLMPYEDGFEIQAAILQEAESLDKEAYKKLKEKLV